LEHFDNAGYMKLTPGMIEDGTSRVKRHLSALNALGERLNQAQRSGDPDAKRKILEEARVESQSLMNACEDLWGQLKTATT
jgi:hypothetical protein